MRVQSIIRELPARKSKSFLTAEDGAFAQKALSREKSRVCRIIDPESKKLEVIVEDSLSLSLAIGKEGAERRCETSLIGWDMTSRARMKKRRNRKQMTS